MQGKGKGNSLKKCQSDWTDGIEGSCCQTEHCHWTMYSGGQHLEKEVGLMAKMIDANEPVKTEEYHRTCCNPLGWGAPHLETKFQPVRTDSIKETR